MKFFIIIIEKYLEDIETFFIFAQYLILNKQLKNRNNEKSTRHISSRSIGCLIMGS